jgi:hypothetical protein
MCKKFLLGIGIALLLILAILFLVSIPNKNSANDMNFTRSIGNVSQIPSSVILNYCKDLNKITSNDLTGVLSDTNNSDLNVSKQNERAKFLLIYNNKKFLASVSLELESLNYSALVQTLKDYSIKNLVLDSPKSQLIKQLEIEGINCFVSSRKISGLFESASPILEN